MRWFASIVFLIPRRLLWAVGALLSTIIGGTVGYMVIEGWSPVEALHVTINTVATAGFLELRPPSPAGRLLSIFLILFGVGVGLYTITTLVQWVMEGRFRGPMRERRMKDRIARLNNHYI